MAPKIITVGKFQIGGGLPLAVIAGPCVIENKESAFLLASALKE
jgi:3-deoxy-D-manno-octulosonic acid (KDO) 8-phosphate synthase